MLLGDKTQHPGRILDVEEAIEAKRVGKSFYRKEVGNGRHTSFWYDNWSPRGVLSEILGDRGIIDMGIRREATVEAIISNRRRRRHRSEMLNDIKVELNNMKEQYCENMQDASLWKRETGFKQEFSTQKTWKILRGNKPQCGWAKGVWFSQATPKYSFMVWLATLDRMATMDRVSRWSNRVDTVCVLCKNAPESKNHLFFECSFSSQVWEYLVKGILGSAYTNDWNHILRLINDLAVGRNKLFCIRYAFQASVYAIWRERNKIRHEDKPLPLTALKKMIEKGVRNKLSLLRTKGGRGMDGVMQFWFSTRI